MTLVTGTQDATSSAVKLNNGNSLPCVEVEVQNNPDSAGNVLVGTVNGQYRVLEPGQAQAIPASNVSMVYIKRADSGTAATVNWISWK